MANLEIMAIENSETVIANTKDAGIKSHIQAAHEIALRMDKDTLALAYHIAATKPLLEGNTSGYPTDHKEFSMKVLGVARAQYYNIMQAGTLTTCMYDSKGKNPVYVDAITYARVIKEKFNGIAPDGYSEELYKELKKRKVFTSTKLLTIVRKVNERREKGMAIEYDELTGISPSMTVKEIVRFFNDNYAIEMKTDEGKTDEGKTDEGKTDEGKTDEGKTEEGKTTEQKKTVEVTRIILAQAMDDIRALSAEMPHLASLYDELVRIGIEPLFTTEIEE